MGKSENAKGKISSFHLVLGILLIAGAIVFVWVFNGDRFAYLAANENIFDLDSSEIEQGKFYKVGTGRVLGCYYYDESSYYMLMLTKDNKIMGLYADASQRESLEKLWGESDEYLYYGTDPYYPRTDLGSRGEVFQMTKIEKEYFDKKIEELKSTELYGDFMKDAQTMPLTIEIIPMSRAFNIVAIFWFLFAITLIVGGVFMIRKAFTVNRKKQPDAQKKGPAEQDEDSEKPEKETESEETESEEAESEEIETKEE